MTRKFTTTEAKRDKVPLLIGLVGPSSGGKTFSALRLATGIQNVVGGDIYGIDTEARRMKHYADRFRFRHLDFEPPHGPLDYLAAIEHCVSEGARTVIIDSFSHEHEGVGGVLEMHDAEVERRYQAGVRKKGDRAPSRASYNFSAWAKPKSDRRRLLNRMLQLDCNFILCFRAKEKVKPSKERGRDELLDLGWMPIGGEEHLYEMTARALLPPNADGVPVWRAERPGEKLVFKLPEQFRGIFDPNKPHPLCEADGEAMARWAAGPQKAPAAPSFSTKFEWDGSAEWAGKPLADAPDDVLVAYGAAVEVAKQAASEKTAKRMASHLEEIRAAQQKGAA